MSAANTATPQFDPNVKIPAAVRMASERASQLHKEEYNTPDPDPNADKGAKGDDKLVVLADAPKTEPKVTVEVQDAPPVVQQSEPKKEVTDTGKTVTLEAYNALKGRWDQAQTALRERNTRVTELETRIAALEAQVATKPPAELQASSLLTPQEREDFGDQFLDVAGRRAREVIDPEIQALKKQVTDLTGQLSTIAGSTKATNRQQMHDQLDASLPKWKEINTNPEFIAWLGLPDVFSGAIRHELLKTAYDRNDATRVAAFFKSFLAEEAAFTPAEEVQTDPQKVSLESLAAPGRPKTATVVPKTPAASQIITRAEISKFYADVTSGKYRGREKEQQELEAQIFRAENEGRIQ